MKLCIYNKKEIIKTFESDEFKLKFGVLEDLIDAIELDNIKSLDDDEIIKFVTEVIPQARDTVKDLLKEMFDDITDEDIREAAIDDIAVCLSDAIKYVVKQVKKNMRRGSKN